MVPFFFFGALFIFFVVAIVIYRSKKGSKDRLLLLAGPSFSGKTVLFHKICSGELSWTVPSMRPGSMTVVGQTYNEVLDFPGHPRLRSDITRILLKTTSIVFMVDATNSSYRDAAEYL